MLLAGPAGTGKTRAGCEKIHLCAEKYAGCRILLARQTRKSLTDTALVTLEEHVMPVGHPAKKGARRGQRSSYIYPNGSEIVIGGLDNADKVMSAEYDLVYIPEATETLEEDVEKLTTRLRNGRMPYQQLLLDCNPSTPQHWLKRRADRGQLRLISATHEDNPRLFNQRTGEWTAEGLRYLSILDALSGARRERLRFGKWVAPEGSRFPQAAREIQGFHLTRKWPQGVPQTLTKFVSIDYGLAAPYCALWHAIDHDGNVYTYREDYAPGFTADKQAQRVIELSPPGESYYAEYLDPAMWAEFPGHTGRVNKSAADYYHEAFMPDPRFGPLMPGFNKRRAIAFMTLDALLNHDNPSTPNWYIEHSCENLWRELEEAVFAKTDAGIWTEDLDKTCDDHALTAAYYGLHTHLQLPTEDTSALPIDMHAVMAAKREKEIRDSERAIGRNRASRVRI